MHTIPCGGVEEEGAPLAGEGAPRGRPGGAALPRDLRPLPGELQPQTDITFDYFSDYYFTSRADYFLVTRTWSRVLRVGQTHGP